MTALDTIQSVLDLHGKLRVPAATLTDTDDLYAAGMTSHASVNVMLALEDAFAIEFPDELLSKTTFCTINALQAAIASLVVLA